MNAPPQPIAIPDGFLDRILADIGDFNRRVHRKNPAVIRSNFARTQWGSFEMLIPFVAQFDRPVILEIGSGCGFSLCFLLKNGFDAYGVEPGNTESFVGRYEYADELLRHNGLDPTPRLFPAAGEELPFPDDHFDIVCSIAVLEHVRDPDAVMAEALRVCRPGGCVVMNVPNYDCFYEAHYNIPWLPYVLRKKARAAHYVQHVWRRDPYYIAELNFTVPGDFKRSKPWAAQAGSLTIYPFLFRPLLYVSALAYFLGVRNYQRHPVLKWFAPGGGLRFLHRPAGFLAGLFTALSARIGLAPVFNVIAYKRTRRSLPDGTGAAAAMAQIRK